MYGVAEDWILKKPLVNGNLVRRMGAEEVKVRLQLASFVARATTLQLSRVQADQNEILKVGLREVFGYK